MTSFDYSPRLPLIALTALALAGCDDGKKLSEKEAFEEVAHIAPIVKEDVEQVRKGLPAGAAKLAQKADADTLGNNSALQKAVADSRAAVKELDVAKSTFFAITDAAGTVLRSETDPDMLAGKSVITPFPALKKALDPAAGVVEAFGEMTEMRGQRTGQELAWVAVHPMKDDKGLKGLFVTGWSFRKYAAYLDDKAKRHVSEISVKAEKKTVPIVYVFLFKGSKAYGSPLLSADVNAQAIEGLGILEKTSAGPYKGNIEITGRNFGVAAQRTPELGDDAAVVVLLSEI
ncbi:MAG: hypothetical protein ABI134_04100 [Byssovorax sp.]